MTGLLAKAGERRKSFAESQEKLGEQFKHNPEEAIVSISPDLIDPNPWQYRKIFKGIEELAEDIKKKGQLQPCLLRPRNGRYQLILGERRFRACKLAGIEVKAIVKDYSDLDAAILCQTENQKREDTSAIENYFGIKLLQEQFDLSSKQIMERSEIKQSTYYRIVKFDDLPEDVLAHISESHLAEIYSSADAEILGDLFKSYYENSSAIAEKLIAEMHALDANFPTTELKGLAKAKIAMFEFVAKWAADKFKPSGKPKASVALQNTAVKKQLLIDGRDVGSMTESGKKVAIQLNREDIPQDKFLELMELLEVFFDPITPADDSNSGKESQATSKDLVV